MKKKLLSLKKSDWSKRLPYQTDMHGHSIEGGALNAGYDLVETVSKISAELGRHGYIYGKDFEFIDQGYDDDHESTVEFSFKEGKYQEAMVLMKLKK